MTKILSGLFLALLFLTVVSAGFAQLPTGTILGVVKDASGAVIPGATVTIRNVETDLTRTITTGAEGAFRVPELPVGHYTVKFEKTGFKTQTQTSITLEVAQELAVNSSLDVGTSSQEITVTAEAPLVSTTTSSLSSIVDEQRVSELPLNGRNINDLTLLQPGVTQHIYVTTSQTGLLGTEYSSNGAPIRANLYLLDGGIMNTSSSTNGASILGNTLGVDGILEYRVITSNFDAEYGQKSGSQQVNVSKSGTNQFHGSAFEFLRNSALDARNFFDLTPTQLGGYRLPEFRRNNFGGAAGGPIKKDKTFFFGVFEGLRQSLGTTNTTNVLQAGCHGAANATITPAECPALTSTVTIAPQMAPLIALYPLPNIGTNQFGFSTPQPTTENYAQGRIDHTISSHDNVFGRYTFDRAEQTSPLDFPQYSTVLVSQSEYIVLSENHIFSSSMVNSARFNYSRTNPTIIGTTTFDATAPQYAYITGQPMGALAVSGLTANGTSGVQPKEEKQNIFAWGDDLTYSRGNHALKFGFVFNHYQEYYISRGTDKGSATFGSVAAFLTAQALSYSEVGPGSITDRTLHFDAMGFYAQDSWRVRPRLTLNMGLRYEPTTTINATNGDQAALRNVLTDTSTTFGPFMVNPSLRNWGPRFGFAWDVFGNGRTAIRGGFSELYDQFDYGNALTGSVQDTPPYDHDYSFSNVTMTIPFVLPANAAAAQATHGVYYNMKQPHALQYNGTVQQELPGSMSLSVAFVGSRGIHILQDWAIANPAIPNGIPVNGVCVTPPAGTIINLTSQFDNGSGTSCYIKAGLLRRNPAWTTLAFTAGTGDSHYSSLQVVLNKRASRGLVLQAAYTQGSNWDYTAGGAGTDDSGPNSETQSDPLHAASEKGPADFDVRHNLRVSAIYHFPNFTSSGGFTGKLVNGWWTSGIWSVLSGYPITVFDTSNVSNDLVGTERLDVVPGRTSYNITHGVSSGCGTGAPRAGEVGGTANGTAIAAGTPLGTPQLWYDPCAFTPQTSGFIGDEPRNFLRGPGDDNLNFSLVKDTTARFLGEGGKVEFRAEFFNVLNHVNFESPLTAGVSAYAGAGNPLASAGQITAQLGTSRQIQFGLRIMF